ncbi:MAG TPA: hypothetical protein VGH20_19295 [Myxococcales bacterium]|jgi:hypothetical protein
MKWLFCILALVPLPALAYNEAVHAFVTRRALSGPEFSDVLQPPTQADLDAFREAFARASGRPLRDAYEFKELLMLDPAAQVHGFDLTPDDAQPMTRGELLEKASRWPDDDGRNRNRFFRDARREVVRAEDGSPIPYDPATLDFGGLTGTTSQGHAHYGLVSEPLSSDPKVLKKEPWRFAVPATAHAYGPEFVRIYTELAQLAGESGLASGPWLQAVFAGAAFHHLEDLCNQIHTVQVGIYEFFQAAFVQSKLQDLKTMGGVLGPRYSLKQVGLRLIANHHLLSEDLFAKRVAEAQGGAAAAGGTDRGGAGGADAGAAGGAPNLSRDDPAIHGDLAAAIIQLSSREAPEAYRLAWTYSAKSLRDGIHGHEYKDGDDPDQWVSSTKEARAAMDKAYALGWKGLSRAATAVRAEWGTVKSGTKPALTEEAAMLTAYHHAAAERRSKYKPAGPETLRIAWGYPITAALILVVAVYFIARRARRDEE